MRRRSSLRALHVLSVLPLVLTALALPAAAADDGASAPRTERLSVAPDGTGGNGHSGSPSVSADGRVVAFVSQATNLVPGTTTRGNVFVRTAPGAALRRVSPPGETTSTPALSADGRYLTFASYSTATERTSVHVMDLKSGRTERLAPALPDGYAVSYGVAPISGNGRYVAFVARPTDDSDPRGCQFHVLDRVTERVQQVSRASQRATCQQQSMSADGRKIAYQDGYTGPSDDDQGDILVHDRRTGRTVKADATHDGAPAEQSSVSPSLSADGSTVSFASTARNLVPGTDPNDGWNVFVRDLRTGSLTRVDGHAPTDLVVGGQLSTDGSRMLVNIGNADRQPQGLWLRDLRTGQETLLSPGTDGKPVGVGSTALSADASTAVFDSFYPGLVPDDTNWTGDVFVRHLR
ncbi:translocation protein TolB [Streptomyces sp. YIM 121038]|uniref:PD40 domain-containing protein n=1 Tax=Streptomyces sp. YIM 121038 TaxID=2136401 RepID=UPI00111052E6|nr:PD40 domain-containing protein [Streptomyces sp. YIM 121038]QCX81959.1 translocation protein TolB [Streptomyces sp. YIM 121038]